MSDHEWGIYMAILRDRSDDPSVWARNKLQQMADRIHALTAERDEARRELEEWRNSAAHVEADHPDEVHCGCVPVLRKLLTDVRRERDEARRSCCEFAAMVDVADTVVMYVDSNRFHEIAMKYMKDRGWDCFKEDGK